MGIDQPAAQRTVAAVGAKRAKGHHEALLGDVLGIVRPAKDAEAGPVHRHLLALDQHAERIAITGQNGVDEAAVIHGLIVPRRCCHRRSVVASVMAGAGAVVVAVLVFATRAGVIAGSFVVVAVVTVLVLVLALLVTAVVIR